jgi:hypothetical protein
VSSTMNTANSLVAHTAGHATSLDLGRLRRYCQHHFVMASQSVNNAARAAAASPSTQATVHEGWMLKKRRKKIQGEPTPLRVMVFALPSDTTRRFRPPLLRPASIRHPRVFHAPWCAIPGPDFNTPRRHIHRAWSEGRHTH